MKLGNMSKTALFCVSLLGSSIPCLATESPSSGEYSQKVLQEEAIIVRIDQSNVTLQSIGDKSKTITAPFGNAAEFKVGDKVIVMGNTLKKNDGLTEKAQPKDASSDTKADPAANKM